jgi:hypothetical protein
MPYYGRKITHCDLIKRISYAAVITHLGLDGLERLPPS